MKRRAWDARWLAWLAQRGPHVQDRILRLNPAGPPRPGEMLGGYFRAPTVGRQLAVHGHWSRGRFLREFGRDAWAALTPVMVRKQGRRMYVHRHIIMDFGQQFREIAEGKRVALDLGQAYLVFKDRGSNRRPAEVEVRMVERGG